MNQEAICRQCKAKGFYRTPELNEQLYLHFAGYTKIENLEAFTACRVLWLEHNLIEAIENLETLEALRVLHVEHNKLRDLGDCPLPNVETLSASHNFIHCLKGLRNFPNLQRLYLSDNDLEDDQLDQLLRVPHLVALDLGRNKFSDPQSMLDTLCTMKSLKSLILSGNPVVRSMPSYRKKLISSLPTLMHLDDMPVFENERRTAEAWARGGRAAEAEESKLIKKEEEARRIAQRQFFEQFLEDARTRGSTHDTETPYARTMRLAAEEDEARELARREASSRRRQEKENATRPVTTVEEDRDQNDDDIVVASTASPPSAKPKKAVVHVDPFAMVRDEVVEAEGASSALQEKDVLAALQLTPSEQAAFACVVEGDVEPSAPDQDTQALATTSASLSALHDASVATAAVVEDEVANNTDEQQLPQAAHDATPIVL